MDSSTLKLTSSSYTHSFNFPLSTLIITFAVFMNGRTNISGTSTSSSISITTKFTIERNLSTFTNKSSNIPYGCLIEQSAS